MPQILFVVLFHGRFHVLYQVEPPKGRVVVDMVALVVVVDIFALEVDLEAGEVVLAVAAEYYYFWSSPYTSSPGACCFALQHCNLLLQLRISSSKGVKGVFFHCRGIG